MSDKYSQRALNSKILVVVLNLYLFNVKKKTCLLPGSLRDI
jgi:hypothetical protein